MNEAFDAEMERLYWETAAITNPPTRFLIMLRTYGGVFTAKRLLRNTKPGQGFYILWSLRRMDLSVEALVLGSQWRHLFTEEELRRARHRLNSVGYPLSLQ